MWTYHQDTGAMIAPDGSFFVQAWSGAHGYMNDPSMNCEKDKGPIPRGEYTFALDPANPRGPYTLRLTPAATNNMCDIVRDGFLIHTGQLTANSTGSTGCIIITDVARRQQMANSPDHRLRVVADGYDGYTSAGAALKALLLPGCKIAVTKAPRPSKRPPSPR